MTERLGTPKVVDIYGQIFTNKAHVEATLIHREWLKSKYDRIATHDILGVIDKANIAKQRYAELYNDIALFHGIGIDKGQVRAVESPIVQLAALLAGEPLTLSGRENPTAKGVEPLQARLFVADPVDSYAEQAFNRVTVELIDPNSAEFISVVSSIKDSRLNPKGRGMEYESSIVGSAMSLKKVIVNGDTYVSDCPASENTNGPAWFNRSSDIHTATIPLYAEMMNPEETQGGKNYEAIVLHDRVNSYTQYLNRSSDELLRNIGLIEWLIESAKDGDLNPHLVEKMLGAGTPVPSTTSDEYTTVFAGGKHSVIPISHIKPWKLEPTDLSPQATTEGIPDFIFDPPKF